MPDVILGIDVGKSGGIAVIDCHTKKLIELHKTPLDQEGEADSQKHLELFSKYTDMDVLCIVEKVTGRYGDAASSAFNFGITAGKLHCALTACSIDFKLVHPKTWMKYYKISREKAEDGTKWKNRLKSLAISLYPEAHVTLWSSDAILLAHYGLSTK